MSLVVELSLAEARRELSISDSDDTLTQVGKGSQVHEPTLLTKIEGEGEFCSLGSERSKS